MTDTASQSKSSVKLPDLAENFQFYVRFAKPLVLNLAAPNERVLAAAWVQKLCDAGSGDERLRTDYLKLLLFVMQKGRLFGPFAHNPTTATLEDFGMGLRDVAKAWLETEESLKQRKLIMGLSTEYPPISAECSGDLTEYAAAQDIPNFGVHAYYAFSDDPITNWDNMEKGIFPKGALSAVKKSESMSAISEHTRKSRSKTKDKSLEAMMRSRSKSRTRSRSTSRSVRESGLDISEQSMRKVTFQGEKISFVSTSKPCLQSSSPLGSPLPVEERTPPTWGSNLISVNDPPQTEEIVLEPESKLSAVSSPPRIYGEEDYVQTSAYSLPYRTPSRISEKEFPFPSGERSSFFFETPPTFVDVSDVRTPPRLSPKRTPRQVQSAKPYRSQRRLGELYGSAPQLKYDQWGLPVEDLSEKEYPFPSGERSSFFFETPPTFVDVSDVRTPPRLSPKRTPRQVQSAKPYRSQRRLKELYGSAPQLKYDQWGLPVEDLTPPGIYDEAPQLPAMTVPSRLSPIREEAVSPEYAQNLSAYLTAEEKELLKKPYVPLTAEELELAEFEQLEWRLGADWDKSKQPSPRATCAAEKTLRRLREIEESQYQRISQPPPVSPEYSQDLASYLTAEEQENLKRPYQPLTAEELELAEFEQQEWGLGADWDKSKQPSPQDKSAAERTLRRLREIEESQYQRISQPPPVSPEYSQDLASYLTAEEQENLKRPYQPLTAEELELAEFEQQEWGLGADWDKSKPPSPKATCSAERTLRRLREIEESQYQQISQPPPVSPEYSKDLASYLTAEEQENLKRPYQPLTAEELELAEFEQQEWGLGADWDKSKQPSPRSPGAAEREASRLRQMEEAQYQKLSNVADEQMQYAIDKGMADVSLKSQDIVADAVKEFSKVVSPQQTLEEMYAEQDVAFPHRRKDVRTPPLFSKVRKIREGPGRRMTYAPEEFGISEGEVFVPAAEFMRGVAAPSPGEYEREREREKAFKSLSMAPESPGFMDDEDAEAVLISSPKTSSFKQAVGDAVDSIQGAIEDIPAMGGVPTTTPKKAPSPVRPAAEEVEGEEEEEDDYLIYSEQMPEFISPDVSPINLSPTSPVYDIIRSPKGMRKSPAKDKGARETAAIEAAKEAQEAQAAEDAQAAIAARAVQEASKRMGSPKSPKKKVPLDEQVSQVHQQFKDLYATIANEQGVQGQLPCHPRAPLSRTPSPYRTPGTPPGLPPSFSYREEWIPEYTGESPDATLLDEDLPDMFYTPPDMAGPPVQGEDESPDLFYSFATDVDLYESPPEPSPVEQESDDEVDPSIHELLQAHQYTPVRHKLRSGGRGRKGSRTGYAGPSVPVIPERSTPPISPYSGLPDELTAEERRWANLCRSPEQRQMVDEALGQLGTEATSAMQPTQLFKSSQDESLLFEDESVLITDEQAQLPAYSSPPEGSPFDLSPSFGPGHTPAYPPPDDTDRMPDIFDYAQMFSPDLSDFESPERFPSPAYLPSPGAPKGSVVISPDQGEVDPMMLQAAVYSQEITERKEFEQMDVRPGVTSSKRRRVVRRSLPRMEPAIPEDVMMEAFPQAAVPVRTRRVREPQYELPAEYVPEYRPATEEVFDPNQLSPVQPLDLSRLERRPPPKARISRRLDFDASPPPPPPPDPRALYDARVMTPGRSPDRRPRPKKRRTPKARIPRRIDFGAPSPPPVAPPPEAIYDEDIMTPGRRRQRHPRLRQRPPPKARIPRRLVFDTPRPGAEREELLLPDVSEKVRRIAQSVMEMELPEMYPEDLMGTEAASKYEPELSYLDRPDPAHMLPSPIAPEPDFSYVSPELRAMLQSPKKKPSPKKIPFALPPMSWFTQPEAQYAPLMRSLPPQFVYSPETESDEEIPELATSAPFLFGDEGYVPVSPPSPTPPRPPPSPPRPPPSPPRTPVSPLQLKPSPVKKFGPAKRSPSYTSPVRRPLQPGLIAAQEQFKLLYDLGPEEQPAAPTQAPPIVTVEAPTGEEPPPCSTGEVPCERALTPSPDRGLPPVKTPTGLEFAADDDTDLFEEAAPELIPTTPPSPMSQLRMDLSGRTPPSIRRKPMIIQTGRKRAPLRRSSRIDTTLPSIGEVQYEGTPPRIPTPPPMPDYAWESVAKRTTGLESEIESIEMDEYVTPPDLSPAGSPLYHISPVQEAWDAITEDTGQYISIDEGSPTSMYVSPAASPIARRPPVHDPRWDAITEDTGQYISIDEGSPTSMYVSPPGSPMVSPGAPSRRLPEVSPVSPTLKQRLLRHKYTPHRSDKKQLLRSKMPFEERLRPPAILPPLSEAYPQPPYEPLPRSPSSAVKVPPKFRPPAISTPLGAFKRLHQEIDFIGIEGIELLPTTPEDVFEAPQAAHATLDEEMDAGELLTAQGLSPELEEEECICEEEPDWLRRPPRYTSTPMQPPPPVSPVSPTLKRRLQRHQYTPHKTDRAHALRQKLPFERKAPAPMPALSEDATPPYEPPPKSPTSVVKVPPRFSPVVRTPPPPTSFQRFPRDTDFLEIEESPELLAITPEDVFGTPPSGHRTLDEEMDASAFYSAQAFSPELEEEECICEEEPEWLRRDETPSPMRISRTPPRRTPPQRPSPQRTPPQRPPLRIPEIRVEEVSPDLKQRLSAHKYTPHKADRSHALRRKMLFEKQAPIPAVLPRLPEDVTPPYEPPPRSPTSVVKVPGRYIPPKKTTPLEAFKRIPEDRDMLALEGSPVLMGTPPDTVFDYSPAAEQQTLDEEADATALYPDFSSPEPEEDECICEEEPDWLRQSQQRISPGQRLSPGQRISPGQRVSPGPRISPSGHLMPPSRVSPAQRVSPSRVSPRQRVSPRVTPAQGGSPRVSPYQRLTPEERIPSWLGIADVAPQEYEGDVVCEAVCSPILDTSDIPEDDPNTVGFEWL